MDSQPQSKADFNLSAKLFSALGKLRDDLAKKGGVMHMPYHIFRDVTMKQISEKVPITKEELLEINGLGEGKVSKYGDRVLEIIKATFKELYKEDSTESIKRRRDNFLTVRTKKRISSAKLYSALLVLMVRDDFAKEAGEGVMEYHIFLNTTLDQIIKKLPRTKEELLEINSLSKVIINKYGDRILEIIEEFLKGVGNVSIKRKNNDIFTGSTKKRMVDLETCKKDFVDYKSFSVTVNGMSLDSKLSESNLRHKYYELCLSKKSYLHEHLMTRNPNLATNIILETVNIANAIQSCVISTSHDDFSIWDTTLQSFELLGMNVDFLRSRVNHLRGLALQFLDTPDFKRLVEAKLECTQLEKDIISMKTTTNRLLKDAKSVLQEEDIVTFETALNRLKDFKNVLQSEIETLNVNVHKYEVQFEEISRASW